MKHLIVTEYDVCLLELIEEDVLDFTHKTAKEMLAHLLTQSMNLTNCENSATLKET